MVRISTLVSVPAYESPTRALVLTRRDEQQASEVCSFYYRPSVAYLRYADRHTVLSWDRTHRPPPTFFQAGSASASPTSQRLTGITDWLIMQVRVMVWKLYYASPAESRRPVAPLVKCGESWCSDVYHRASCRGCSREAGGRVGCLALLALHASFVSVVSHASAASAVAGGSREVATGKVPISYVSLLWQKHEDF